jgi:hypothetical protein
VTVVDPVAAARAVAHAYPNVRLAPSEAARWIASQLALKARRCAHDVCALAVYEEHADPGRMAA